MLLSYNNNHRYVFLVLQRHSAAAKELQQFMPTDAIPAGRRTLPTTIAVIITVAVLLLNVASPCRAQGV